MTPVVLERRFEPPMTADDFTAMALESASCLTVYRVEWRESLLAEDGSRLLCRFEAPDAESVRMIARDPRTQTKVAWSGTVHDTGREEVPNVVVERAFEEPVTVEELQAVEDAGAWCMDLHKVTFLRTFFSSDRRRMICLYKAPDAESVRLAQEKAGMPMERAWSCRRFDIEHFM